MTEIRFEVPELIADRCTGCGQCWTQCPDAAIPGLVTDIDRMIETAVKTSEGATGTRGWRGSSSLWPRSPGPS